MGSETGIEWCDATWNPTVGCTVISPGCTNCYAMKMAARLDAMGQANYHALTQPSNAGPVWNGIVRLASEKQITLPYTWKKPRRIFVNSMSDLFHRGLSDNQIARVFEVMANVSRHTYLVLTKRSDRMRDLMNGPKSHERWHHKLWHRSVLPNVWLGVSVENRAARTRIDDLRATPAAVRFVSFEPLLEDLGTLDLTGIDWAIIGGESGPDARTMYLEWARSIIAQCRSAGVAVFVKQLSSGTSRPIKDMAQFPPDLRVREFPEGRVG